MTEILILLICFSLAGCDSDSFISAKKCIGGITYEKTDQIWYKHPEYLPCVSDDDMKKIKDK